MLRRLAKLGVARAWRALGGERRASRAPAPLVLGYHRVTRCRSDVDRWLSGMAVSVATLERQLDAVGRRRRFVSLDEIGARVRAREPFERPVAAVTFDDGYADVHENALPLLRRKGIPAAVFVVTDLVGTATLLLHDRLFLALRCLLSRASGQALVAARLAEAGYVGVGIPGDAYRALRALVTSVPQSALARIARALEPVALAESNRARRELRLLDWPMLKEMAAAGFIVGSHTQSHALLPLGGPAEVAEELMGSRRQLAHKGFVAADHIAYPAGACTTATLDAADRAGYRYGFTICSHQDAERPELTIPRRMLWERSGMDHRKRFSDALFSYELHGGFDGLSGCRERHGFAGASA